MVVVCGEVAEGSVKLGCELLLTRVFLLAIEASSEVWFCRCFTYLVETCLELG